MTIGRMILINSVLTLLVLGTHKRGTSLWPAPRPLAPQRDCSVVQTE